MATTESTIRRLWRPRAIAAVAAPLALIFIIFLVDQHLDTLQANSKLSGWRTPIHYGLVLAGALIAIYAVNTFTRLLGHAVEEYLGLARARATATFVSFILYCAVILIAINSAGANLSGLLLGGAVTGVIVGITGQASLSNVIAGLVILFAHPYRAGMYVTVRAGVFGGVEYSGQVWDISLFYTTLHSAGQEIRVPNSTMVAAVVVLRPQELDVYIPITFPPATDIAPCLEMLRRAIAGCTAARRTPQVTLEKVTELGYIVGVRVFVAGDAERRAVERAIAGVVQQQHELTPDAAPRSQEAAAGAATRLQEPITETALPQQERTIAPARVQQAPDGVTERSGSRVDGPAQPTSEGQEARPLVPG